MRTGPSTTTNKQAERETHLRLPGPHLCKISSFRRGHNPDPRATSPRFTEGLAEKKAAPLLKRRLPDLRF